MNIFRAVGYINRASSLRKAFFVVIVMLAPLINFIGIPLVIGYLTRLIPLILEDAADLPPIGETASDFLEDLSRGMVILLMSGLYFVPIFYVLHLIHERMLIARLSSVPWQEQQNFYGFAALLLILCGLMFSVGVIRYTLTGDAHAFFHLKSNARLILSHPAAGLSLVVNGVISLAFLAMALFFWWACLFALLFIPIWLFVMSYLMACYAAGLGLAPMKIKRKNDHLLKPKTQKVSI